MKTVSVCIFLFLLGVLALMGWRIYLDSPHFASSYFLSPRFYYELPTGGYVYIEGDCIRYNQNDFNGVLDYQITLNYEFVKAQ